LDRKKGLRIFVLRNKYKSKITLRFQKRVEDIIEKEILTCIPSKTRGIFPEGSLTPDCERDTPKAKQRCTVERTHGRTAADHFPTGAVPQMKAGKGSTIRLL